MSILREVRILKRITARDSGTQIQVRSDLGPSFET